MYGEVILRLGNWQELTNKWQCLEKFQASYYFAFLIKNTGGSNTGLHLRFLNCIAPRLSITFRRICYRDRSIISPGKYRLTSAPVAFFAGSK